MYELLQAIRSVENGYVVYKPEVIRKPEINIDELLKAIQECGGKPEVSGKWIVVKFNSKVYKVLGNFKSCLKSKGFSLPITVSGKYEVVIPKELRVPEVRADVSIEPGTYDLKITLSSNTYPIKDELKKLGFKFKDGEWVKSISLTTADKELKSIVSKLKEIVDKYGIILKVERISNILETDIDFAKRRIESDISLIKEFRTKLKDFFNKVRGFFRAKGLEEFIDLFDRGELKIVTTISGIEKLICFKPKGYLPYEEFKKLRSEWNKIGGKYISGYGFCTSDEKLVTEYSETFKYRPIYHELKEITVNTINEVEDLLESLKVKKELLEEVEEKLKSIGEL